MEFKIDRSEKLNITDSEITEILNKIYVEGGFTEGNLASTLFKPESVRNRGMLFGAREKLTSKLAGIVILVPPGSSARKLAGDNEAEMHLLGVKPEFRGYGLGKMLIDATIEQANKDGYAKMILWTQNSMKTAQSLYESKGFDYIGNLTNNNREFRIYEKLISDY